MHVYVVVVKHLNIRKQNIAMATTYAFRPLGVKNLLRSLMSVQIVEKNLLLKNIIGVNKNSVPGNVLPMPTKLEKYVNVFIVQNHFIYPLTGYY